MHTIMILLGGLLLLGLFVMAGRALGNGPVAALWFMPAWLLCAGFNLWYGVSKAGYSVHDESPIFLVIFALPAAVALFTWWKLHPR